MMSKAFSLGFSGKIPRKESSAQLNTLFVLVVHLVVLNEVRDRNLHLVTDAISFCHFLICVRVFIVLIALAVAVVITCRIWLNYNRVFVSGTSKISSSKSLESKAQKWHDLLVKINSIWNKSISMILDLVNGIFKFEKIVLANIGDL